MYAIEIQGLSKEYAVGFLKKQRRSALKPLILSVEAGETFGFLGPNGAGKTTRSSCSWDYLSHFRIGNDSGQGLT